MSSFETNESASYWSRDSPDNLRLRVTLRHRSRVVAPAPAQQPLSATKASTSEQPPPPAQQRPMSFSCAVRWQRKLFSPREVQQVLSAAAAGKPHPLAEEYARQKEARGERGPVMGTPVFTLVEGEQHPVADGEGIGQGGEGWRVRRWERAKATDAREVQRPENDDPCMVSTLAPPGLPHRHIAEEESTTTEAPPAEMWIMAAVGKDPSTALDAGTAASAAAWEGTEHVLCRISFRPPGLFDIKPGLNNADRPWFSFSAGSGAAGSESSGEVFEYEVRLASDSSAAVDSGGDLAEAKALKAARAPAAGPPRLPLDHPMPEDPATLRLFVLGEIVSASGLIAGGTFVEYFIDLPDGWTCLGQAESLTAATQTVMCGSHSNIGHPFELFAEARNNDQEATVVAWPMVHFVLHSIGSWQRHAVIGYGHVRIPRTPGIESIDVPLWRPVGGIRSQMRSFFIGGYPELADVFYESAPRPDPTTHQLAGPPRKPLSKFGLQTEPAGMLTIRVNCVLQSKETPATVRKPARRQRLAHGRPKTGTGRAQADDLLGSSRGPHSSTADMDSSAVAAALERVRRRVEEIKRARETQKPASTAAVGLL